ncbi:hypothetical protein AG1IA_09007 [Rhizoctonia solani AG-1 IA]|uniref:Secreted protein n=1 Tax=Thanatephorus cucumeris (strain AG1-IA) TaxID=983506 RepID=L8WKS5_THACA|nr:hypothetical protein AG1IA_09007 [Rhizoctonia solani AG-1 IA]
MNSNEQLPVVTTFILLPLAVLRPVPLSVAFTRLCITSISPHDSPNITMHLLYLLAPENLCVAICRCSGCWITQSVGRTYCLAQPLSTGACGLTRYIRPYICIANASLLHLLTSHASTMTSRSIIHLYCPVFRCSLLGQPPRIYVSNMAIPITWSVPRPSITDAAATGGWTSPSMTCSPSVSVPPSLRPPGRGTLIAAVLSSPANLPGLPITDSLTCTWGMSTGAGLRG